MNKQEADIRGMDKCRPLDSLRLMKSLINVEIFQVSFKLYS